MILLQQLVLNQQMLHKWSGLHNGAVTYMQGVCVSLHVLITRVSVYLCMEMALFLILSLSISPPFPPRFRTALPFADWILSLVFLL